MLTNFTTLSSLFCINNSTVNTNILLTYIQTQDGKYVQKNPNDSISISSVISKDCYFANSIFEIIFLNELQLQIRYNDNGIIKYLTKYPDSPYLKFFNTLDFNTQTFYYFFDKVQNQLSLFITIGTNTYSIRSFATQLQAFNDVSLNTLNIFNIRPYYPASEVGVASSLQFLTNTWVSYASGIEVNTTDIQENRSEKNIQNNFLEFINYNDIDLTAGSISVEFLPLKNQLTEDATLSRGNIFNQESNTTQRFYHTLHLDGNTITAGYTSGIKQLEIPCDKLTYFRFPYISSPFVVLNINDSNLVAAGAIAGDIPINSDKVFKQRSTDYKDYQMTGEQNGTWLCAWLSGSSIFGTKPIWVDRYYNPNFITLTDALGYNSNPLYIDEITNIIMDKQMQEQVIFDLPSKLVFEPHVLYAYHHLGNKDLSRLIDTKSYSLIVSGADTYETINNFVELSSITDSNGIETYSFTGSEMVIINPLSAAEGSFTLSFNLYTNNYQSQFASQVIGNYYGNTGIGIFNTQNSNLTIALNILNPGSLSADQITLNYNLSGLNFGWHNIVLVMNTEQGYANFYIDGFIVDSINFTKGLYTFSKLFSTPLYAGLYTGANYKLKDIRIYDTAFSFFDIRNLAFTSSNIRNIKWYVPSGQRNFIDTIERFFKFTLPGRKTNTYNIVIQNSGITNSIIQSVIENKITNIVQDITPVYTQLNKIIWRENE
jgi:hypothetical protein